MLPVKSAQVRHILSDNDERPARLILHHLRCSQKLVPDMLIMNKRFGSCVFRTRTV
jgi:hypothetical protein